MGKLEVYTSRVSYRGRDRFDITVKSGVEAFAPTWGMVRGFKNGSISEEDYTEKYLEMMRKSKEERPEIWRELLEKDRVVLVCYCKAGEFCHRLLLADILVEEGAVYCGEI